MQSEILKVNKRNIQDAGAAIICQCFGVLTISELLATG